MNNELQHYGVIGMKWGRRKSSNFENKETKITFDKDLKKNIWEQKKALVKKNSFRKKVRTQGITDYEIANKQYRDILNTIETKHGKNAVREILGNAYKRNTLNAILFGTQASLTVYEVDRRVRDDYRRYSK